MKKSTKNVVVVSGTILVALFVLFMFISYHTHRVINDYYFPNVPPMDVRNQIQGAKKPIAVISTIDDYVEVVGDARKIELVPVSLENIEQTEPFNINKFSIQEQTELSDMIALPLHHMDEP